MTDAARRPLVLATPQAGDVGLVHYGKGFSERCIRWGQSRKYPDPLINEWEHAFMLTDNAGGLIEAQPSGMKVASLAEYSSLEYILARPSDLAWATNRFVAVAAMQGMLNEKYGYLEIFTEALTMLTSTQLRIGLANQRICSGSVAVACAHAGVNMVPPTIKRGDGLGDEGFDSPADIRAIMIANKWIDIIHSVSTKG